MARALLLALLLTPSLVYAAPEELGDVAWRRDFDAALEEARREKRPVLILFDEVPGCSTVKDFGRRVLRHPEIVSAAEKLFIPVVVYNNVEGADRKVLRSFSEPTWNNPVVRFIDADRRALTTRHAGDYTVAGLAKRMVEALEASEQAVPSSLRALAKAPKR